MSVNCWKYAREVYVIGREMKFKPETDATREAAIAFIVAMAGTRPAYVPYINAKAGNPPVAEFEGEGEARKLIWDKLAKQNILTLAKMIQKIGRSLKIQFCTEEEKAICDTFFAALKGETVEEAATVEETETTDEEPAEEGTETVEETETTEDETTEEGTETTEVNE